MVALNMRPLIALLAIPASLVQLVAAQSYGTSVVTNESCLTQVSKTTAAPSPVPTTTTTADAETSTATLTVTVPEAVTTENAVKVQTNYNTITIRKANATVTGGTATVTNNAQVTVATNYMQTITVSTTACTGDTVSTVTVPATTTVFGNSTAARKQKRNPNPFSSPLLRPRQASAPTTAPSASGSVAAGTNLPIAVVCTQNPTSYLLLTTTITSGTSTVPASSTSTSIVNIYATRTVYYTTTSSALTTVTVTHSSTLQAIDTTTSTLTTQCALSTLTGTIATTITRASACAPSAMTSAAGSYDIVEIDDHPMGGAAGITTAEDPSACCQLCLDTEDCAAAAHLPQSGTCRLEFTSPASCGIGLYALQGHSEDGNQGPPGTGWWVQNGCGTAKVFP